MALGGGPIQLDAGIDDVLGEVGVLGEEPKTGMDGVSARRAGGLDHSPPIEEVERVLAGRVGDDGPDAEEVARSRDPMRDLAAVRDEDGGDGATADCRCGLRSVKRVKRDTPSTTNASSREPTGGDPALDGASRRSEPPRDLARAQLLGHFVASVAYGTGRD